MKFKGCVSSPGEYYIIEYAQPGCKVPKTGDTASPALWIGLAVLGLGGLSALTLRKRRKALR